MPARPARELLVRRDPCTVSNTKKQVVPQPGIGRCCGQHARAPARELSVRRDPPTVSHTKKRVAPQPVIGRCCGQHARAPGARTFSSQRSTHCFWHQKNESHLSRGSGVAAGSMPARRHANFLFAEIQRCSW